MSRDSIIWEADALKKLNKAPFFIRGFAKRTVENAAVENGLSFITLDFMEQVRKKEMKKSR